MPKGRGMERFVAGDPLRGLAALSVLTYHVAFNGLLYLGGLKVTGQWSQRYGEVGGTILRNGELGLFVFFVLSGYLLARPFTRAFLESRPAPRLGSYLRNRLLRIVPAFWAVFALTLAFHGFQGATVREILFIPLFVQTYDNSLLAQHIGQAWTLDVELGYYLLLPLGAFLLSALARRGSRLAWLLAGVAAVAAGSLLVRSAVPVEEMWLRSIPATLFFFTPGILLAALEPTALRVAPRWGRIGWGPPALAVSGLLALIWYTQVPVDAIGRRALLAGLGTGALVAAPMLHQWRTGRTWRGLDNRLLHWVGERSYGIYLLHLLVLSQLMTPMRWADSSPAAFAIGLAFTLALTLAAADLLFRFVERPALRLRKRWRTVSPGVAGAPTPAPAAGHTAPGTAAP